MNNLMIMLSHATNSISYQSWQFLKQVSSDSLFTIISIQSNFLAYFNWTLN